MNERRPARHASAERVQNVDPDTVAGFGDEWSRFDFAGEDGQELDAIFAQYFSLFPWQELPPGAVGADIGAGSGRWAARVAPRVGQLHVLDASADALKVARNNLGAVSNVQFHHASVGEMPLVPGSLDFAYSLGVLHHVPDTAAAIRSSVALLKPGAPFLLYLYYALDGRPLSYRLMFHAANGVRRGVSRLPHGLRFGVSQALAASVYWPLARGARVAEALGADVSGWPLAYYRDRSFYVMRNDALDRFGTRLEQRFTRQQIDNMMQDAGLERVVFRDGPPYWCALGYRKGS